MEKRTLGFLAIFATILLCACPGSCLFMLVGMDGVTYAIGGGQTIFTPVELVILALVATAGVAVPILIALAFFAPLPGREPDGLKPDEPLPPAI